MTSLRDLMIREGAAVACAKRRDALCFIRLMLKQASVPVLNYYVKWLKEGIEPAKTSNRIERIEPAKRRHRTGCTFPKASH